MEDNEKKPVEELEIEEPEVEEPEEPETEEPDIETNPEDYKEYWEKRVKTLEAQKAHWKKKAEQSQDKPVPSKPANKKTDKVEQVDVETAMDIRFLQRDGYSEDEITKLKIIQKGYEANGKKISLIEATQDELFKAISEKKEAEKKKDNASLSPSGTTYRQDKPLTEEEFEKVRKEKSEEALRNMGFKR